MTATSAAPSFLATRRGKLTLPLCAIGFSDFVGASIIAIARHDVRTGWQDGAGR